MPPRKSCAPPPETLPSTLLCTVSLHACTADCQTWRRQMALALLYSDCRHVALAPSASCLWLCAVPPALPVHYQLQEPIKPETSASSRYKPGDYVRVKVEDSSVRYRKPHLRTPGAPHPPMLRLPVGLSQSNMGGHSYTPNTSLRLRLDKCVSLDAPTYAVCSLQTLYKAEVGCALRVPVWRGGPH